MSQQWASWSHCSQSGVSTQDLWSKNWKKTCKNTYNKLLYIMSITHSALWAVEHGQICHLLSLPDPPSPFTLSSLLSSIWCHHLKVLFYQHHDPVEASLSSSDASLNFTCLCLTATCHPSCQPPKPLAADLRASLSFPLFSLDLSLFYHVSFILSTSLFYII